MRVTTRGLDDLPGDLAAAKRRLSIAVERLDVDLADATASAARRRANRDRLSGTAANSIRSQGPTVVAGGGVAWYGFADFGGRVGAGRRVHRPYVKGGRWLGPAVREVGVLTEAHKVADRVSASLQ